ncbi:hypothetical protein BJ508DRAFT_183526, partial [Ascobolus immersus RN42]
RRTDLFSETQTLESLFKPSAIKAYETAHQNFLEKLFFYIHLASGQPARGTEIAGLQICNEANSGRGLYIFEKTFCILVKYSKTQTLKNDVETRRVVRFIPKRINDLLLKYFFYVRPFR